jgi:ATP-dependent exoDNAse (exonuclease V) beta subunit
MQTLVDINSHPRDKNIYMDEPTHTYYLNNSPVSISGTGFLHLFFEPFNSAKTAEELVKKAKVGTKYYGKTVQEIIEMWNSGTNAGTIMHKNIEDFWNGMNKLEDIGDKSKFGLFQQCYGWLKKLGLEPFRTEWIIYDEDYDIAGSIDFVAKNPQTGKYWVIDWKRSNQLRRNSFGNKCGLGPCSDIEDCNGFHYQIQVNLYRHILEKRYGIEIEQCSVINLHPDGKSPDILIAEDMQEKVKEMLQYWLDNKGVLLEKHRSH